jgi:preprotein translocase subunit SecG
VTGTDLLVFATVMDVVRGAIMTLFILSSFLVILVVLAQEGKGGGLAGAFGGAGSETFGVKAGTVNTFTAWVGAAFLGLALLYAGLSTAQSAPVGGVETIKSLPGDEAPAEGAPEDGAPEDAGTPPKDGETPKDDAPKDDAPKDEAPKDEAPKDEAPKDEAPKDEAPKDADPDSKGK